MKRKQTSEDLKWKKPELDYEELTRLEEDDSGDEDDLDHEETDSDCEELTRLEEDESESDSEDDLNHERDYWFWENRNRSGEDILEWLRYMIRLYKWSQKETYFRR